ncbi:AIG2-like protein D [Phoenix dactylifera]|uniref:Putative gamma-glutamylcyclotransferase n=1 Tax=Phoenix dactylifera TaxID=42345 RepID=A0A8B7CFH9_PHODC|nr:AIG2-like protein D [Phoenix dactylifera]
MGGEGVSVTAVAAAAAASTLPLHSVFVYGSLLADEVVQVLLKRVPSSSPAVLHHHHRFSIKGRVYPAILPVENKKVAGKVLLGITDRELDVLDTFEDVEYERRAVEVSLADTAEKLLADTYVWGDNDDPNLHGDWDFEEWKRLHMKDFLAMTMGFMEELEQPESKTRVATYESYFQQG